MATNFPTSLDNLTNPAGSDPVNNPSHASQHANINDAIEVLEAKVGVTNSAVTTSLDYRVRSLETNPTYTNEMAQDAVAAALAAGTHTNITINYNDTGNSISISAAAGYTNEEAVDAVAAALTAGSGISISYNDSANTITISVDNTIATKTYVDTAVSNLGSTAASTYVPVSEVGQADGIATLDATGQVPFSQLGNLVASAPATLNTLNELATALGNDANFATTTATSIGNRVSKAGGDIIQSSLSTVIPLVVKGAASQSANLQEWQDSAGNLLGRITSTGVTSFYGGSNIFPGDVRAGTSSYLTAALSVASRVATESGLVVRGFASQSANLQEWQNSAGTVLAKITPAGQIINDVTGAELISIRNAGNTKFELNQYSQGWSNTSFTFGNYYNTDSGTLPRLSVFTSGAGQKGAIIRGSASQTANLQEWQNSAGTILARITSSGVIGTTQNVYASRYYYSSNGTDTGTSISFIDGVNGGGLNIRNIDLGTPNAGFDNVVPLTISGNINQTANLQNWNNAAGTVLSKVDASGAMFTITPADSTNTTQVATTAYVKNNINNLINSAPGTLDTLGEIATALAASDSAASALVTSVNLKAPLASPALTGTPTAPTAAAGTNTTQLATTAFVKTELSTSIQPGALYQTSAPASPAIGQIWIDSDDDVTTFDSNIIRRKAITATAGQTVFTADLPFIDGFEQIFMNGLLLVKTTDYATSGGNTVTLTSGAAASDVIEIVSVTGANSINTYTQAETNALLAANTSVAPLSISANTTLVAKKRYFVTSASALTLTLPASPALNDEIQILDASGNSSTYNITVARNANKINGGNNNLIIDTNGGWYTLLYTGSTYGWKVG